MKRVLTFIMLAAMLLTACHPVMPIGGPGEGAQQSQSESMTESRPEDLPEEGPSMMESREAAGSGAGVYRLPCEALEGMQFPSVFQAGASLLIRQVTYDDQGVESFFTLRALDQKTGELQGEFTYSTTNYVSVQIVGDHICLSDNAEGWIKILDHRLTPEKEYSISPDYGSWYISSDLQKLYSISWEGGIRCVDLEALSEEPLLENVIDVIPSQVDEETLLIGYTDLASQVAQRKLFSLTTGELTELPLQGQFYQIKQAGDVWMYNHPIDWMTYIVHSSGQTRQVTLEDGYMVLLDGGHLLCESYKNSDIKIYDGNGAFLLSYTIEPGYYIDSHWAWNDYYGGYFGVEFDPQGRAGLLFLDLNEQQIGAPLALKPYEIETKAEGSMVSAQLYERAQQLSEQYDVDIRIAEQCGLEYTDFTASMLTDEWSINWALDSLETALAAYPEGFFTQLQYGSLTSIRIEIVHNLKDKRAQEDDEFSEFNGFTRSLSDHHLMVLDAETMYPETIYHEFTHLIDARLEYDAWYREEAVFSEETWLELQPEGYEFPYDYTELPDEAYEATEQGYFARIYGATYPGEDRATIMEIAMLGYAERFHESPALLEKLAYYSDCIRDCFDTATWPAITKWEEPLYAIVSGGI
ncbi:MAG: hypothetical protein IJN10_08215 [Firmicutes bacterium]|nr:hypothetical protein [Bacillota bacterium]